MHRYDDSHSSSGSFDSGGGRWDTERFMRERQERQSRRPRVAERPRRVEDERFELRFREKESYGPPARRTERDYEDEDLVQASGALMPRGDDNDSSQPPPRPRLLRRQSSLDTFDRIPPRRRDPHYQEPGPREPPPMRRARLPRSPPQQFQDRDYYEEIRIAEPDYYGDEEFRAMRERRRRRSSSNARFRERVVEKVESEKPYPRKGKTRMPRRLVHPRAIIELGYPFIEEDNMVVIQKALSKEQIDEVISFSQEFKKVSEVRIKRPSPSPSRAIYERVIIDSPPRAAPKTMIIEPSPPRWRPRSRSRYLDVDEVIEKRNIQTVRPRSVSGLDRRRRPSSPGPFVERREVVEDTTTDTVRAGNLAVIVRPRDERVDDYVRDLEVERRLLRLERGGVEIIRERDKEIVDSNGNRENVLEVTKDRKGGPDPRVMRMLMATLT